MPSQKKIEIVAQIEQTLNEYKHFIITDYRGLTVEQLTNLRKELMKEGVIYQIVKNNLIKIAIKNKNIEGIDQYFCGPTAIAFSKDEPISTSKILAKFVQKTNNTLKLKGAYSTGRAFDKEAVNSLSKIDTKEILIASLMNSLQSPMTKLVGVFNTLQRKLVYTLNQISSKDTN